MKKNSQVPHPLFWNFMNKVALGNVGNGLYHTWQGWLDTEYS